MSYKYENVVTVEAKEDFEVHDFDENGEITETFQVKKGMQGTVEWMGYETGDPESNYGITFDTEAYGELSVSIYESNFEQRLSILKVEGDLTLDK